MKEEIKRIREWVVAELSQVRTASVPRMPYEIKNRALKEEHEKIVSEISKSNLTQVLRREVESGFEHHLGLLSLYEKISRGEINIEE